MADRTCLYDVLSVQLVLREVSMLLPFSALVSLASASKLFYSLIHDTPGVFRRLDLSSSLPRAGINKMSHNGRGVEPPHRSMAHERPFAQYLERSLLDPRCPGKKVLGQAQILVLDNQAIPGDVLQRLLLDTSIPLKILSVVEWAHGAAFGDLLDVLHLLCSTIRPEKRTLQGVYAYGAVFGVAGDLEAGRSNPVARGVTSSLGATLGSDEMSQANITVSRASKDAWYNSSGPILKNVREKPGQGNSKQGSCDQLLDLPFFFDAVRCRGLKHAHNETVVASFSLPPCEVCQSAPEGLISPSQAPTRELPLLKPIPLLPSIKLAQLPSTFTLEDSSRSFLARCADCVSTDLWCSRCGRFWCESCHDPAVANQEDGQGTNASHAPAARRLKVYNGLCSDCLVIEMYQGAGSGGMWG